MHKNKKISALLGELYNPDMPSINPGLERVERLLARLGNPHHRIPPVIHVAGTNGKGSVCANLAAIYTAAGLRVHRYNSPHLVTFNERITLAGEMISDKLLRQCLQAVVAQAKQEPVTFFEATTAAAFLAFSLVEADICILEVGLGGRLDATNVIDKPLLTIITPIGYDHQEYLGNDIRSIAAEKAGILKPGVPCVLSVQLDEARQVVIDAAKEIDAPLYAYGDYWKVEGQTYESERKLIVFESGLEGEHQIHNASVALASVEALNKMKDWDISAKEGSRALLDVDWPGRLQRLELKKSDAHVWLDGAHNMLGAAALASWLVDQEGPRTLAIGMLENRDVETYMKCLAPFCDRVIAIDNFTRAGTHSTQKIEEVARSLGKEVESVKDVAQLIKRAEQSEGTVLITGSLYLVGAVIGELD